MKLPQRLLCVAILGVIAGTTLLSSPIFSQTQDALPDFTINVQKELDAESVEGPTPDVSSGSFTVAARVQLLEKGSEPGNDGNSGMLFAVGSGWTDGFRVCYDWRNGNRYSFQIGKEGGCNGCSTASPSAPGVMREIIAVCDGNAKRITLYVDGQAAAGCDNDNPLLVGSNTLKVGFVGMGIGSNRMYVDTVEYWSRALTEEEIQRRNSFRDPKELTLQRALDAVSSTTANATNIAVADNQDAQLALDFELPESAKAKIREATTAKQLNSNQYAEAAPAVFANAEAYIEARANATFDPKPNDERLSKYGEIASQLRAVQRSVPNARRAKALLNKIEEVYPEEASVFKKIEQLEASAERSRKVEKDALSTYERLGKLFRAAVQRRVLRVSPAGNDSIADGSPAAPFGSLAAAFDYVAKNPSPKITRIEMAPGVYQVDRTATLANAENVYVRATQGGKVVLSGGRAISNFKALADAAESSEFARLASERFDASVQEKIYVADLRQAGIADFGRLARRGFGGQDVVERVPSLYLNGESQTLARWPNEGDETLKFGEIVSASDALPTSTFKYDFDRPDRWQNLDDVWAFGLYQWEWAANLRKVNKIDREKKEIEFDYSNGSGRFDYYFVNVLEELDAPGEYFVDATSGLLYFYPPETIASAKELNKANVEYDDFSDLFISLTGVKNFYIEGITFKLGRESFGRFQDCERCYVTDCVVEQFGGNVLTIRNGSFCGMLNSRMRELGACGLRISAGDRENLIPSNHIMHNNFVSDFSRIDRVYAPAVHADGCGVAITNNLMCDSPHHAMRTDGNDMYVARNEIHSCVYEYSDQSGIDIYCDPSYRGIVIEKNLWRHIGSSFALCGQAGIRLDDSISGVIMLDNVFYRSSGGSFGGIQIHGGKDNLARGNLMVDCQQAFSFSPWSEERYLKFVDERFSQNVNNPKYLALYPFFKEIKENANRNYILDNIAVNCGRFNANGNQNNVFSGNICLVNTPELKDLGVYDVENAQYAEAFYDNNGALRNWLELLGKRSLKDVGLKGRWNGANAPVSPHYRGIESDETESDKEE